MRKSLKLLLTLCIKLLIIVRLFRWQRNMISLMLFIKLREPSHLLIILKNRDSEVVLAGLLTLERVKMEVGLSLRLCRLQEIQYLIYKHWINKILVPLQGIMKVDLKLHLILSRMNHINQNSREAILLKIWKTIQNQGITLKHNKNN
jgi:hypothetical protein